MSTSQRSTSLPGAVPQALPILATLIAAMPSAAGAQATAQGPANYGIEEVVVTAQRREQNLQETPVAVTALTGADLSSRSATDLSDITEFTPNLTFTTATQSSRSSTVSSVYIRGVGETDFIITVDPPVGIYVDGVYYGRATGGVVDMLDIERVEVLRGPQGTLFGKNNIGGALNITSARPTADFGGLAEVTYGSFDQLNFRGTINVPFSDTFLGRLAVLTKHNHGYGRRLDFATGADTAELGKDDKVSARLRLTWTPSDTFEANFAADFTQVREPQVPDHINTINPAAPLLGLWNALVGYPSGAPYTPDYLTPDDYESYATGPNKTSMDQWGASLTLDWDIGAHKLKSITAYRNLQSIFSNDGDGSPLRVLGSDLVDLDQHQFSQELQLAGKDFGDRLDWIAGLYYYEEKGTEYTHAYVLPGIYQALEALPVLIGPAGPIGLCPPPEVVASLPQPGPLGCAGNPNNIPLDLDFAGTNGIKTTNFAVFGQGNWAFDDQWSGTLGVRYTWEDKTHDLEYGRVNSGFVIAPAGTRTKSSWGAFTPKIGVEFKPTGDLMWYLSASRGFRSGGFNGRPFYPESVVAFDPEYLWAYELGLKSAWFDRRLIANAAVFFNDYTDVQLTSNRATADGNVAIFTENGGKAHMKGFELELHARPIERLDLTAGVGYIDAKFVELNPGVTVTLDTVFPKTPDWNYNLAAEYVAPLGSAGSLSLRGDYYYRSKYYNDVANTPALVQDAFGIFNARIAFESASQAWQLAVYGTNLTDKHYITGGVGGAGAIGLDEVQYARPREWGVTATYHF